MMNVRTPTTSFGVRCGLRTFNFHTITTTSLFQTSFVWRHIVPWLISKKKVSLWVSAVVAYFCHDVFNKVAKALPILGFCCPRRPQQCLQRIQWDWEEESDKEGELTTSCVARALPQTFMATDQRYLRIAHQERCWQGGCMDHWYEEDWDSDQGPRQAQGRRYDHHDGWDF